METASRTLMAPVPGVAVVDARGQVLSWNAAAERLTGWSAGEILGAPFPFARDAGDSRNSEAFRAGLAAADPEGFPILLRDDRGGGRPFHAWASPIAETERYTVLLSASPVLSADGDPADARAASAEASLDSEEDPHPVMRISSSGGVLYANPAARAVLAAVATEPEGGGAIRLPDIVRRSLLDNTRQEVEIGLSGGRIFSFDCVPCVEQGWANVYGRDITRLRDVEEELIRERDHLQTILEAANVGMLLVDESGGARRINNTLSQWVEADPRMRLGGQPGDVLGCVHAIGDLGLCGQAQDCLSCPLRNAFESVLKTGEPVRGVESLLMVSMGGSICPLWLEINADPLDLEGNQYVLMALTNITERKLTEDALRESEARYRTLFSSIDAGFCVIEVLFNASNEAVDYRFLEANPAFERHTGLRNAVGKRARAMLPEVEDDWLDICGRVAQTGESVRQELGARSVGRWFDVYAFRVGEPQNRTIAVLLSDIAKRKRAEEALRESEAKFATAFKASPNAQVISTISDGTIREVNAAFLEMFGYERDEVVGRSSIELGLFAEPGQRKRAIEMLQATGSVRDLELRIKRRAGDERETSLTVERMWLGGEASILTVIRDVTEQKRMEQALRKASERLKYHVENSPLAVVEFDAGFRITRWSQEAERVFGWAADEVLGKGMWEVPFVHPEDRQRVDATAKSMVSGERPRNILTNRNVRKDGKVIWCVWHNSALLDENGALDSVLSLVLDVTEREEAQEALRESEARFRAVADNISQLAWMADAEGGLFWYNRRWFDYTGTTLEQMHGWGWASVHHPDHIDRVTERWTHHLKAGEPWEDVFPLRRADGEFRWFLSRAFPVKEADGTVVRWFGTNTDITELRQMEEELRRRAERLAATDRAKDEFLAMLAHELRNPLGAIGNVAALIEMFVDEQPRLKQPIETLNRQVRHTARIVDDLLDVSRITQGKMKLSAGPVDLGAIVQRAAETVGSQMALHRHEFTVSVPAAPVWVEGDSARLEQVVGNLLSNAAKYTDPEGHISLSLEKAGNDAVIRVEDDGQGISEEMLPRVFDLFSQEDRSLDRSKGGLGIGLTLVRQLVEMHAGTVGASSPGPGKGSTFTVRLPCLSEVGQSPLPQPEAPETPQRRCSIVLVEDNLDAAAALADILEAWGHAVRVVHDGPAAVQAVAQWSPDIVLLDIGLPIMNGYDVAKALRREHGTATPRLVALTGYGHEDDRRRSREAGFDEHLAKPVDIRKLRSLLAAI